MEQLAENSLPTRHSLLKRLKNWQDEASWRDFFNTYWELLYNVSNKSGLSDAEAQEAVQETIISVAHKIGSFQADPARGSFKAWLLQQVRWRIADQFERRKSDAQRAERFHANQFSLPGTQPSDFEMRWETEWQTHLLRAALERTKAEVSAKQFQMFDLHALQGLSVSETGRMLGVSVASVYMAKSRITRLLSKNLERISNGDIVTRLTSSKP